MTRVVKANRSIAFYCVSSDFHPYECDRKGKCPHCDRVKTEDHDPAKCAFCIEDAIQEAPHAD